MISVHRADAVCIMLLMVLVVMCVCIFRQSKSQIGLIPEADMLLPDLCCFITSLITAPLLLGPLRFASDAPAVLKPEPFSTIVPMVEDRVQNG